MKKFLVVLLLVMCAGTLAFADQVQVNFVSAPFAVAPNEAGPYLFNIVDPYPGGTTSSQLLVCWSELNSIDPPTQWLANTYTIATVPSYLGETATTYKEIAFLAAELLGSPGNNDLQLAVWFAAGLIKSPMTAGATADFNAAVAAVGAGYDAAGAIFYIPITEDPTHGPQPLVGFVPEPGSLMLLGTGILGAAGAIRRRLAL